MNCDLLQSDFVCGLTCRVFLVKIKSTLLLTNCFVELVHSNSNVILTWQTCGHRSSRVAESKNWALTYHFSVRIWYVFLISIRRGKSHLGLCTKRSPTDTFASHPIHVSHTTHLVLHFCPPYPALHIYPTYLSHPIFLFRPTLSDFCPSLHICHTPMGHDWL